MIRHLVLSFTIQRFDDPRKNDFRQMHFIFGCYIEVANRVKVFRYFIHGPPNSLRVHFLAFQTLLGIESPFRLVANAQIDQSQIMNPRALKAAFGGQTDNRVIALAD